ncbi:AraC family transcriptional regulator [Herbaspirillum sp. BH-1]|jgi:AraC-like DNA-binding protein|uniref:AraC-like DNA-binding protein n=1 Tax=Herbaspirillum frisingense TaxID=92645 RepID=A0ABU1PCF8_9BURK|nr:MULTISPECIES: AraC family transcriptional regulator [Herbaspirillum]MDR6583614.1 AraC-like DNA-binding protein [Herbaspirillum frisingense]PLY57572.1 AraC family transcriptional regulator [Herbaspirillum sp. BH-1]
MSSLFSKKQQIKNGGCVGNFPTQDRIVRSGEIGALERIEAFFHGCAYGPHRHDMYAIGITLSGVQTFNYRKETRFSLPGKTMVIHPDELHDGEAGTSDGFHYRIAYIAPALFQSVIENAALPFIKDGVSSDPCLFRAVQRLLFDISLPHSALESDGHLLELAEALQPLAGIVRNPHRGDFRAAQIAREYIHDNLTGVITLDELANISGRDRWNLSRDFRFFFATSPYRYLTMRRLDLVRRLTLAGVPLAKSAAHAGFSDQSHMTRQFVKTYGISPAKWLRIESFGNKPS